MEPENARMFSKETVNGLHTDLKLVMTLNNLRLYKIVKALPMIAEGKSLHSIIGGYYDY